MAINDPTLYASLPHPIAHEERTAITNLNDIKHAIARGGHKLHEPEALQSYSPSAANSFHGPISPTALDKIRKPTAQIGQAITKSPFTAYSPRELAQRALEIEKAFRPENLENARAEIYRVQSMTAELDHDITGPIKVALPAVSRVVSTTGNLSRTSSTVIKFGAAATGTAGLGAMAASVAEYTVAAVATVTGATAAPFVLGGLLLIGVVTFGYFAFKH